MVQETDISNGIGCGDGGGGARVKSRMCSRGRSGWGFGG